MGGGSARGVIGELGGGFGADSPMTDLAAAGGGGGAEGARGGGSGALVVTIIGSYCLCVWCGVVYYGALILMQL